MAGRRPDTHTRWRTCACVRDRDTTGPRFMDEEDSDDEYADEYAASAARPAVPEQALSDSAPERKRRIEPIHVQPKPVLVGPVYDFVIGDTASLSASQRVAYDVVAPLAAGMCFVCVCVGHCSHVFAFLPHSHCHCCPLPHRGVDTQGRTSCGDATKEATPPRGRHGCSYHRRRVEVTSQICSRQHAHQAPDR